MLQSHKLLAIIHQLYKNIVKWLNSLRNHLFTVVALCVVYKIFKASKVSYDMKNVWQCQDVMMSGQQSYIVHYSFKKYKPQIPRTYSLSIVPKQQMLFVLYQKILQILIWFKSVLDVLKFSHFAKNCSSYQIKKWLYNFRHDLCIDTSAPKTGVMMNLYVIGTSEQALYWYCFLILLSFIIGLRNFNKFNIQILIFRNSKTHELK